MVSATRWLLRTYTDSWVGNDKTIVVTTDRTVHCWLRWTARQPFLELDPEIRRGVAYYCHPKWRWWASIDVEQNEPGDTTTHTFSLPDWVDGEQRWYYFWGTIVGDLSPSNSPFFTETYVAPPGPPPPEPTPTFYYIPFAGALLAPPNRYALWANGAWYAILPLTTSITIWRLAAGVFSRQDQPNEPGPGVGTIRVADARLLPDGVTIAVAYYSRATTTDPCNVSYVEFDALTDTWGLPGTAATPTMGAWSAYLCSLSITSTGIPHILYGHRPTAYLQIYHVHRETGAWSVPAMAFAGVSTTMMGICPDHDPANNLHAAGTSNTYRTYWNKRAPAGTWPAQIEIRTGRSNINNHHMLHAAAVPHFALLDWPIDGSDHGQGEPPVTWVEDVATVPGNYPKILTPSGADPKAIFLARHSDSTIWRSIRPSGGAWGAYAQWLAWVHTILTAAPASDTVFAVLVSVAAPNYIRFQAFNYP